MQLPHALDGEFKRVAKEEETTMEILVTEIAELTGYSVRQIYNFRSGKWAIPSPMIPALCKRFRSRALLDALIDDCRETQVDVPDGYDLTRLVSKTVRDHLRHYEKFLDAFEDGVIEQREMAELLESGERIIRDVRQFEAIAKSDFERRQRFQSSR